MWSTHCKPIFLSTVGMFIKLRELRLMYEPYVYSLSRYLHLTLPPWISDADRRDDWQTTAWDWIRGVHKGEGLLEIRRDHF
jgi:hypothetical protein